MSFWQLRCCECGKFISNGDYNTGLLKCADIWNWDKTEIEDVVYWCFKCKPPETLNEKPT